MDFYHQWVSLYTIVRKEVGRFLRIWTQTLLPPVINQSLYFIIFGAFIGSQLRQVHGVSYMSFIVPGLVMMAVINSSFTNVVSSFFGSKFQKNIEELLVSPTPNWIIVAGYTAGGALRGMLVGVIVYIIAAFFTHIPLYNLGIVIVFITLTAIVFSLGGLINAIFAKKFDDIAIFPTFVLIPLTYFGGVFYSIQDLPQLWQNLTKLNPIFYMIDGFRYGFFGTSDVNIFMSTGILIALMIVLLIINLFILKKGLGLKS